MMRTRLLLGLTVLLALAATSCLNPPDYPDTPSISFKSFTRQRVSDRFGTYDTLTVTISFKDGDGDLGLNNDEEQPPYNRLNLDGTENRYYNNYYLQPQIRKANGEFEDTTFSIPFNSRFPRLAPTEKPAPLRGDLSFGYKLFQGSLGRPGAQLRFRVSIIDRALHESNEVITDAVTIP
ncbi:hypothetical protein [Hymenobacter sp. B81]|uniref:hypothetical protein n=1 Tax=Hymenobacter sp. B81 TaxID=3344878 RepID=UPI0037DD0945